MMTVYFLCYLYTPKVASAIRSLIVQFCICFCLLFSSLYVYSLKKNSMVWILTKNVLYHYYYSLNRKLKSF